LDLLWLLGCRRGDEGALARIIDKYAAYVSTVIYNVFAGALPREDIEEVASDAFLALWQNVEKVNGLKLKAYLGTVARNKAINKLRRAHADLPLEGDFLQVPTRSSDEEFDEREERRLVRKALRGMEATSRKIFVLYYYEFHSVSQIAQETGKSVEAVKKRLARGRAKLQKTLNEEGDTDAKKNIRPVEQRVDS